MEYFGRKPERQRPLGKPRRRWEENIRLDIRETGWEVVDWIHLVEDRGQCQALVEIVMNFRVP
jgi:hypothetical protein